MDKTFYICYNMKKLEIRVLLCELSSLCGHSSLCENSPLAAEHRKMMLSKARKDVKKESRQLARKKKEKDRSAWLKISLYLISLWILFLMWIVLKGDISKSARSSTAIFLQCNIVPLICIVLIFIGFIGYICFCDSLKNAKELPIEITECESINYENLSFLATYIIPLVCFQMETCNEIIVMFAVIFVVGCIFVKTNLYYTNPFLILAGFNVYKIETDSKRLSKGIVIVKGKISAGDSIKYFHISDNVYFGRRLKDEGK